MAIEVTIKNPDINNKERTWMTAASVAAAVSLTVRDTTGFTANDYVVVGNIGEELTECKKLGTITAPVTLAIAALTSAHPNGTLLQKTDWNQYSLDYRVSSSASWSTLTTTDLDWDTDDTVYSHAAGLTTGQYRFRLYNSTTLAYSDYSDIINATGYTKAQVGYMIKKIRKNIGDEVGNVVSDDEIMEFLNDGQDTVAGMYPNWYFLLTENNNTVVTVASTREYAFPTDFGSLEALRFRYISGSTIDKTYRLEWVTTVELDFKLQDNLADDSDDLTHFTIRYPSSDVVYFEVYPTPETAGNYFFIRYWKKMGTLDSLGDSTPLPIPSILESFALSQIYKVKGDENKANLYEARFNRGVEVLKREQKKHKGQPDFLQFRGQGGYKSFLGDRVSSNRDYDAEHYF